MGEGEEKDFVKGFNVVAYVILTTILFVLYFISFINVIFVIFLLSIISRILAYFNDDENFKYLSNKLLELGSYIFFFPIKIYESLKVERRR